MAVVEAHLALMAAGLAATLVTSDADDFKALSASLPTPWKVRVLNGA